MRTRHALNRSSLPGRVAAVAATLLLSLALTSCDDSSGSGGPGSGAAASGTTPAGPVLTVDRRSHDFGPIKDVRPHTTSFVVQNTGSQRLIISNVKRGCGCTSVSLSRWDFGPGESGTMQVTYDPKRKVGRQEQPVTLESNSVQDGGLTELQIKATVEPMIRFLPEIIRFGSVRLGQPHRTTVRLFYNVPDLEIRAVTATHPSVSAEVTSAGVRSDVAGPNGYEAAIEVTISSDAPWGVLIGARLEVQAYGTPEPGADPIEHVADAFIYASLSGELIATPEVLNLGPCTAGRAFRATLEVRRSNGVPFNIEGASISKSTMPGMQAQVRRIGPNVFEVSVFGEVPPAFTGGITGYTNLRTDVPGESDLQIRFSGFVR